MCNDYSININTQDYNVNLEDDLDFNITIDNKPEIVINLNEQGPAGAQGEPGEQGPQGETGPRGISVTGFEPISQEGYDVTYRMTFSDGTYTDVVISNGTGSLKWLELQEDSWVLEDSLYKYSYSGSYSVVSVYKGTNAKELITNINVVVQGPMTYLYSIAPFDGYALCASVENASVADVYIYEQEVASDTWEIEHNLNTYPTPTIIDSGGNIVIGSENYVDRNKIVITFAAPFTGKAYLNYTR